jgi:hypothetical protein
MLEYFRRFLSVLPDRSGYCLNCLSRLYGEPVGVIRDYLAESGITGQTDECGNCGRRTDSFGPAA